MKHTCRVVRPLRVCEQGQDRPDLRAVFIRPRTGFKQTYRISFIDRALNGCGVVHISEPGVRRAYAELSTLAQSSGWSLFHSKNDLWVGAAAHAAAAHLLTMDTDFLPLRGRTGWLITVLDNKTGLPRP